MPPTDNLVELLDDNEPLNAKVRTLLLERSSLVGERDGEKRRADDLHIENLRLQVELARYKRRCTVRVRTGCSWQATWLRCCSALLRH